MVKLHFLRCFRVDSQGPDGISTERVLKKPAPGRKSRRKPSKPNSAPIVVQCHVDAQAIAAKAMPAPSPLKATAPSILLEPTNAVHATIASWSVTRSGSTAYILKVSTGGLSWRVARGVQEFKKLHAQLTAKCDVLTPYLCGKGIVPHLCVSTLSHDAPPSPSSAAAAAAAAERRKWCLDVYLQQLMVPANGFYEVGSPLYRFLHDNADGVARDPTTAPLPGLGAEGVSVVPQGLAVPVSIGKVESLASESTHSTPGDSSTEGVSKERSSEEDGGAISPLSSPKTRGSGMSSKSGCGSCSVEDASPLVGVRPRGIVFADSADSISEGPLPASSTEFDAALVTADDFELVTTLGQGTFGKVMKVRHQETGGYYAMKVLSKACIVERKMAPYIREEKDILASINHPFIVHLYAAFQTDHNLYLLLEFLPGGELYSCMQQLIVAKGCAFKESDARFYIAEVSLALGYLHSKDIVHRDIKPENIVLDREGHAVLTDFGLAKKDFGASTRKSFVGSCEYVAPEIVRGEGQTPAVDWWSLGVLMHELLMGVSPFHGPDPADVYQKILHKKLSFQRAQTPAAASILRQLLDRDASQRLAHAEALKGHEFFEPVEWDLLYERKIPAPFVPDLALNDTRYFAKEFTRQWPSIPPPPPPGAPGPLNTAFPNFRLQRSKQGAPAELKCPVPRELVVPGCSIPKVVSTAPIDCSAALQGVWGLRSLELVSEAGKVSYPWGSEVVGQAMYSKTGQFSLDLSAARVNFAEDDYTKVTRDEMAEAYLTYVSSFGFYTCSAGEKSVTHNVVGSLCPNKASGKQSFEVWFADESGCPNDTCLVLATDSMFVGPVSARTVMRFQRLPAGKPRLIEMP